MKDKECAAPKEHHLHFCELKAKPHNPEVDKLFDKPTHVCANCGGRANRAQNLCAPKTL